ncbi:MAG: putative manganese-dependent inorganic diphosphatase [Erysipelotrichaceae bacterium]|nr:putative manganese-dependent inorganic diphosphatase [Erysipelotrichaceae bacterium]
MANPIYVTGHKNPDTDAIVSAIAYSEYKKAKGLDVIAGRIGPVNNETEYLLERFGFDDPVHLYSGKCNIRDIEYDAAALISPEYTIKEALSKIILTNTRTLFVCDRDRKLLGVLSLSNLNNLWTADERYLSKLLKTAALNNIVKILKAKILNKADTFKVSGKVELAPVDEDMTHEGDIVITSDLKRFREAVRAKAGLIIVIGNTDKFDKQMAEAQKEGINVISTPYDALKVSKLIYQTPTVDQVMIDEKNVIKVSGNETVEMALSKVSKSRYRSYPIIDEDGAVIGALSRYHLLNYQKKRFILVDHNEFKQSIDDIEAAEVIEIVDHHRLGGFEATNPITITTMVVGATATIIANKFFEDEIYLNGDLAAIMLGAILSDTMNFNSPTTTDLDRETAVRLEMVSGLKSDELYKEIIKHAESLQNRRSIDILYDDYKSFDIFGNKVGISQATCKDAGEFAAVKDLLIAAMDEALKTRGLDLIICMLTDPSGSGSYLLARGERKDIINEMYPNHREDGFVNNLMSRKKQLLPAVIKALS